MKSWGSYGIPRFPSDDDREGVTMKVKATMKASLVVQVAGKNEQIGLVPGQFFDFDPDVVEAIERDLPGSLERMAEPASRAVKAPVEDRMVKAPESDRAIELEEMTVAELRVLARESGVSATGRKDVLIAKILKAEES
jgi:hypothetical protein